MADVSEQVVGVQTLVDKLKNQGVAEGQKQANDIIKDAQSKASEIVAKAKSEADRLFSESQQKIEREKTSANEAIKKAFRDSEIALRSKFREAFSAYLKRLVSLELKDKEFLKQFILSVAGAKSKEISQSKHTEVLLPEKLLESSKVQHLVLGITTEMLREGVELKLSSEIPGGIKIRLVGQDIDIDLTDEALSSLLLKYLLPKYSEIVSGKV